MSQLPTGAAIRAPRKQQHSRTVALTWRIPTRTCLGMAPGRCRGRRGGVAQLVRASACHAEGRGFESRHSRHCSLSWRKRTNRRDLSDRRSRVLEIIVDDPPIREREIGKEVMRTDRPPDRKIGDGRVHVGHEMQAPGPDP